MSSTPKVKRYKLEVELLEDLHSGTGAEGGGGIDALQIMDGQGFPIIRASHLKGLWLESARELEKLNLIDNKEIKSLFGEQGKSGPKTLLIQSLRWVKGEKPVIWASTAREITERTPFEETLRSRMYVPAGSKFSGEVEIREYSEASGLEELFLNCIKRTDCLGAKKNRGAGLVRVIPTLMDEKKSAKETTFRLEEPGENANHLKMAIECLDPLSLPATGVPGNIIPCENLIRGQRMMGAFAELGIFLGASPNPAFSNDVVFSDFYPAPVSEVPSQKEFSQWEALPFPLYLYQRKNFRKEEDSQLPWWAHKDNSARFLDQKNDIDNLDKMIQEEESEQEQTSNGEKKPKRPRDGYYLFRKSPDHKWLKFKLPTNVHLRNRVPINREQDDTDLFSVEEIKENTIFLGEVEFRNAAKAKKFYEIFKPVLEGEIWLNLGRGGAPVKVVSADWSKGPDMPQISKDGFRITLTSDLIMRDECLRFYDSLSVSLIAACAETEDPDDRNKLRTIDISDWEEIGGFNSVSGLPKAKTIAVKRGSTAYVSGSQAEEIGRRLAERSEKGEWLGERVREGYGRFKLDFEPLKQNLELGEAEDLDVTSTPFDEDIGRAEEVMEMANSLAEKWKHLKEEKKEKLPSKSQFLGLLEKVRRAQDPRQALDDFAKHAKETLGGQVWSEKKNIISSIKNCFQVLSKKESKDMLEAAIKDYFSRSENAKK